jgi:hypothetical protein
MSMRLFRSIFRTTRQLPPILPTHGQDWSAQHRPVRFFHRFPARLSSSSESASSSGRPKGRTSPQCVTIGTTKAPHQVVWLVCTRGVCSLFYDRFRNRICWHQAAWGRICFLSRGIGQGMDRGNDELKASGTWQRTK